MSASSFRNYYGLRASVSYTALDYKVKEEFAALGANGEAEVWFSDDSSRTLLRLKSKLSFGTLYLELK